MFICFTIVTNNYLAHARSLKESFLCHNPHAKFYIALLDVPLPEEDIEDVFLVEALNLGFMEEMNQRYTPFELSCAMKPYFASYFLETFSPEIVIYLDSDIRVYNNFDYIQELKKEFAIFLTPHILEHSEQNDYTELTILRAGIYNAGFFAITNLSESRLFLAWWKDKLRILCYNKPAEGIFVDQLWLNLVPLFFKKYHHVEHKGYNVAYWNLPERDSKKVVFFHFSGHDIQNPATLSKHADTSINFEVFPDFVPFFEDYKKNLELHNHSRYHNIKSAWGTPHVELIPIPRKKKSYLSVLWKAIRGKIVIEK